MSGVWNTYVGGLPVVGPSLPMWEQVTGTVVFVAVLLLVLFMIFRDLIRTLFSKRMVVEAKLVSKVEVPFATKRVYNADGQVATGFAEKGILYKLYFEVPQKNKFLEFEVPKKVFDVAVEETTGKLDFKGDVFYSFDGITQGTVMISDENLNDFIGLDKKI